MEKAFIESRKTINDGKNQRVIVQNKKGYVWEILYAEPFESDQEILELFRTQKNKYFERCYYAR